MCGAPRFCKNFSMFGFVATKVGLVIRVRDNRYNVCKVFEIRVYLIVACAAVFEVVCGICQRWILLHFRRFFWSFLRSVSKNYNRFPDSHLTPTRAVCCF